MSTANGLKFRGSRFWVTHRRRDFGPFDYEWSKDFCGVEFIYCGRKFGEYCSSEEIYADLKEFELPLRVAEVGSIVMGCLLLGLLNGYSPVERQQFLLHRLRSLGYERFAHIDQLDDAA